MDTSLAAAGSSLVSMIPPPDIVLIMSDQHHARVMGCAGDPLVRTPAIDALAAEGVRFSNAYCPFPLCGPSRMAFMSSRSPARTGCYSNLSQLPSDVPTFAHAFLAAGYETVLAGRMHFVGFDQRHGFERRIIGDVTPSAHLADGYHLDEVLGPFVDTTGSTSTTLSKSGAGHTGYHAYDEAVCATAVAWLAERRSSPRSSRRPFLLVVGLVSPHCPLVSPPDDFASYRARIHERPIPDPAGRLLHPAHRGMRERFSAASGADAERARAAYYGLVSFTDRQVGRIADAARGADAVIVYTSDHGEMMGEHGLWGKNTFYEGSVGIPLVVSAPSRIRSGVERHAVNLMDLGPTLLDLAGAPPLAGAEGTSFAALLGGAPDSWRDETCAEFVAETGDLSPQRMVRAGPWKYVFHHGAAPQLFHLERDPDELDDRSADPESRGLLVDFAARALRGWDPAAIVDRLRERPAEGRLIAEWTSRVRPWEPDQPWFERRPANELDHT